MDNIKKIKRIAQLATVLSKYGFETIVTQTGIKKLIPDSYIKRNKKRKEVFSLSIYERIRLAIEELGPTYIKLGQLLSNREDLLPEKLTDELRKLQDMVSPELIDINQRLSEELSINTEEVFEWIDSIPIAAASLSQVYQAELKNGERVILKVKRKGIEDSVEADLLIIKDFAQSLEKYYDAAKNLGLYSIISAFEKSVLEEVSFSQEFQNVERFKNNFKDNKAAYVPKVYKDLSNNNVLCMEYIDGIKISDKNKILENGLDPEKVASTVVDLYMKQVFVYGFFHADPHSGNIFVLPDGKITFIDYGSVGKMLPRDKDNLGDLVINILRKDIRRVIKTIKKSAIKYNIPNENQLERDLSELIGIIDSTSIKELSLEETTKRFSNILNKNRIILPDYMYLLVRGIVLLEGIGREICPELNLIDSIKPYGIKLVKNRLTQKNVINKGLDKIYNLGDKLEELPDDLHLLIQRINQDELRITHDVNGLSEIRDTLDRLVIGLIIAGLAIGSSILILANMPPKLWGVPVLGLLGFISAGTLSFFVILGIIIKRGRGR